MFAIVTLLCISSSMVTYSEAVSWSRVELSTCNVPMSKTLLSLCCHTDNIPDGASIYFHIKTEKEDGFLPFYRIKPSCVPDYTIQQPNFTIVQQSCDGHGSLTIYKVTVSVTYMQSIGSIWQCGFYGNHSSLVLNANQVLTSYQGNRLFDYKDRVILTWMLSDPRPKVVDIYRPAGDRIIHISGPSVTYFYEGFNVTEGISAGKVTLLVIKVTAQSNGTYVCVYNDSNSSVTRDGITLVLLDKPTTPVIRAHQPIKISQTVVSGSMSCNASSQSAAPLYYQSSLEYVWSVPSDLDDPNFSNVSTSNSSIFFPQVNCASMTSLPVYCQAVEGGLDSYSSSPRNLSSFCVNYKQSAKTYDSMTTVLVAILFITVFILVTAISVTMVVGRKFLHKKCRRCCKKTCICSVCCRSNGMHCSIHSTNSPTNENAVVDSDSDSDLESVLQRSAEEVRRRERRLQIPNIIQDGIEGNANHFSLADGLERHEDDAAVQAAIERLAIQDSLENQFNRQGNEFPMIGEENGAFGQDIDESHLGAVGGLSLRRSRRTVDDETSDLQTVERLLGQHNRHLNQGVVHLDISRENILQQLLLTYTDASLAESRVTIAMAGEKGMDCGGVMDDMYTTFWCHAQEQYFQGYDVVVPYLPVNRWDAEEQCFRTLGRILSHTVALTKSLPLPLCKSACVVMIFDTTNVDKQAILEDFLYFLDPIDRNLVTTGINNFDSLTHEQIDEVQTIFTRFEYPAVIKKSSFNDHLVQLARNTLCVKPKPLLDLMRQGLPQSHFDHFWSMLSISYLEVLFKALRPNPARVISRLKTDPTEERLTQRQRRVFRFLQDFLRELSQPEIETFLQFLTGRKSTPRQAIVVCFTREIGFQRAPKAHTCSNLLELPETYENYQTFKSEFKHLLAADEAMTMTMA